MTTGSIRSDTDRVFVPDGDGLARANDSREQATKIKVLNFIVSTRFCLGITDVSFWRYLMFDNQIFKLIDLFSLSTASHRRQ